MYIKGMVLFFVLFLIVSTNVVLCMEVNSHVQPIVISFLDHDALLNRVCQLQSEKWADFAQQKYVNRDGYYKRHGFFLMNALLENGAPLSRFKLITSIDLNAITGIFEKAIKYDRVDVVDFLLKSFIICPDSISNSLFFLKEDSSDMVRLLVKHGALRDGKANGVTPLMFCVFNAFFEAALTLVELGADTTRLESKTSLSYRAYPGGYRIGNPNRNLTKSFYLRLAVMKRKYEWLENSLSPEEGIEIPAKLLLCTSAKDIPQVLDLLLKK